MKIINAGEIGRRRSDGNTNTAVYSNGFDEIALRRASACGMRTESYFANRVYVRKNKGGKKTPPPAAALRCYVSVCHVEKHYFPSNRIPASWLLIIRRSLQTAFIWRLQGSMDVTNGATVRATKHRWSDTDVINKWMNHFDEVFRWAIPVRFADAERR
jgi:hypothetical protein